MSAVVRITSSMPTNRYAFKPLQMYIAFLIRAHRPSYTSLRAADNSHHNNGIGTDALIARTANHKKRSATIPTSTATARPMATTNASTPSCK